MRIKFAVEFEMDINDMQEYKDAMEKVNNLVRDNLPNVTPTEEFIFTDEEDPNFEKYGCFYCED